MFATLAEIENNGDAQPAIMSLGRRFPPRQFCISQRSWTNFRRSIATKEQLFFDDGKTIRSLAAPGLREMRIFA
jgi:hypothetical protein